VGYHFVNANKVIGDIHTFSIAEGSPTGPRWATRAAFTGRATARSFSSLWHFAGMNIFNGKVVAMKDGQFGPLDAGVARRICGAHGDRL
jgi:hypothetical protein